MTDTIPDKNVGPPAGETDPVALKTAWTPANARDGSSFRTYEMALSATQGHIKETASAWGFGLGFIGFGLCMGLGVYVSYLDGALVGVAIFGLVGLALVAMGIAAILTDRRTTFDKRIGVYYRGKKYDPASPADRTQRGSLNHIHALQLVSEYFPATGRGKMDSGRAFYSHELNLVFRDATRLTVMDHGDKEHIVKSAVELGEWLGVPVWDRLQ